MTVNKITTPPSQKVVIDKINEVIDNLGGGGGSSYTAGTGIDITNDVISVDDSILVYSNRPLVNNTTGNSTEAVTFSADKSTFTLKDSSGFQMNSATSFNLPCTAEGVLDETKVIVHRADKYSTSDDIYKAWINSGNSYLYQLYGTSSYFLSPIFGYTDDNGKFYPRFFMSMYNTTTRYFYIMEDANVSMTYDSIGGYTTFDCSNYYSYATNGTGSSGINNSFKSCALTCPKVTSAGQVAIEQRFYSEYNGGTETLLGTTNINCPVWNTLVNTVVFPVKNTNLSIYSECISVGAANSSTNPTWTLLSDPTTRGLSLMIGEGLSVKEGILVNNNPVAPEIWQKQDLINLRGTYNLTNSELSTVLSTGKINDTLISVGSTVILNDDGSFNKGDIVKLEADTTSTTLIFPTTLTFDDYGVDNRSNGGFYVPEIVSAELMLALNPNLNSNFPRFQWSGNISNGTFSLLFPSTRVLSKYSVGLQADDGNRRVYAWRLYYTQDMGATWTLCDTVSSNSGQDRTITPVICNGIKLIPTAGGANGYYSLGQMRFYGNYGKAVLINDDAIETKELVFGEKAWIYQSSNVTPVGNVVDNEGILSNFTTNANYALIPNTFNPGASPFEWVMKFTTSSSVTTQYISGKEFYFDIYISRGYMCLDFGNGTGWSSDIVCEGTTSLSANTTYWIKLVYSGTDYKLYLSTNGTFSSTPEITVNRSTPLVAYQIPIGNLITVVTAFSGTVDLNECYIDINGTRWWTGTNLQYPAFYTKAQTNSLLSTKVTGSGIKTIQSITQADYDALVSGGTVDANTLYIITSSS